MSSTYNSTSPPVDPHSSRDYDDLSSNNYLPATPFDSTLLSPYNHSHTVSNSASPSYTPGESLSDYSNYQPSEFSEVEDPFFGVNFDAGIQRTDSLPTAIFGNPAYPSTGLNRPLPALPAQTEGGPVKSDLSASSVYPLSPIHTSIPNTPSPRGAINDKKNNSTISHHELTTGLHNSRFQGQPLAPSTIQLSPDNSGSSHTSAEGVEPNNMGHQGQSPHLTFSQWDQDLHSQSNQFVQSNQHHSGTNGTSFGGALPVQAPATKAYDSVQRREDGAWRGDEATGQGGLGPEARNSATNVEVPNLKEQEELDRINGKNGDVEAWRSQAGGSSDAEDEGPTRSYFPPNQEECYLPRNLDQRTHDEDNITPFDDDHISIHENRLVAGQMYFDLDNNYVSESDKRALQDYSRHWNDGPSVPQIRTTAFHQPETANDAIQRFNRHADSFSLASRAATWGTRRRSEPSLADFEGVSDGSFLKKLSISKSKDGVRPRQNSIFDQGLDRLASFARKRSDSKLKRARSSQNIPEEAQAPQYPRHNSQDTLRIPTRSPSFGRKQTRSINDAFAAMTTPLAAVGTTHTRRTSVGNTATSPKSPVHLGISTASFLKRARSKSELTGHEKIGQTALGGLWRVHGGPPLLATTPTPVEERKPEPVLDDQDDEEDDDDDLGDENDMKMEPEQQADPIIPSYEGFKAHVRRLNPEMDQNWLVSRIAHQQEIRYKNLLDLRVKHLQAVNARKCSAGRHCLSLGGKTTLLDVKGNARETERTATSSGLHIDTGHSDNDSNSGDGQLIEESFPQGVPMPPARSLPAEFECQLCFKAKKFQKPSDWTKHVHEDVQPFTCTYDKCKEPKSFKRKADWVRHENERHRHLEWWICEMDECRHPCYRKDNFLQHLVREHKLPEPKQKTKAAIKKARLTEQAWIMLERCHHVTQNRPQDEPCKFCGKSFPTWKKLTVHLAKHMEHISLPILRLVDAKVVNADTIISPVEQIMTPVSPIGRTKLESHSPLNMDSISPHIPMAPQFGPVGYDQQAFFQNTGPQYGMQAPMQHTVNYVGNNNNMFPATYDAQHMNHSQRRFSPLESNGIVHVDQSRGFGMDPGYTQHKMEQPRGFGSLDSSFSQQMPDQHYNMQPTSGYTMPQTFTTAPSAPAFQASNMMPVSDAGYGYDPMAVNGGQNFQQVPMSRGSSYGHSPQNVPQNATYFGHQG